ncbi:MAG: pilin [Candidatus Paceibacterota bacterium]
MNFKLKNILIIVLFLSIILVPVYSFAQDTDQEDVTTTTKIVNPIKASSINGLIKTILEGVVKLGIPIIALAVIYSGFLFVSAQGNPEKISNAKKSFTYTLIGAAILLGAWGIAQLISETVLAL